MPVQSRRWRRVINGEWPWGCNVRILVFAVVLGGVLLMSSKAMARNVRNNNPLNIEYSIHNNWRGQIGQDGRFVVFDTEANGFRAAGVILKNYQRLHKLHTLRGIIYRWAPPVENNTESYVNFVSKGAGVHPDATIDLMADRELMAKIMFYMAKMEGSGDAYTIAQAQSGAVLV